MKNIDERIKEYIENKILPLYKKNIGGHDISHINTVIERSFEIVREFNLDVDYNMVYVIAAFHDIGYSIDPENHEQRSAEIFMMDEFMKSIFSDDERNIMMEAIVDHRASLEYEARNIYGKIVSSADREVSVKNMLERSFMFQRDKHRDENPTVDEIIEYSFKKLSSKYGKEGYAKMYFPDKKYLDFVSEMQYLFENKREFIERERVIAFNLEVNDELRKYIEENIFPLYDDNFIGDGKDRVHYVISRSLSIINGNKIDIDYNILYTAISYHDIRKNNDEREHELVSAQIMYDDEFLKGFFTEEERLIIKDAIEDQRANNEKEPRNIYGKILSSASRNCSIYQCLERSYRYGKKIDSKATDEELFKRAFDALNNKFGENGYAKFFFEDIEYEEFLYEIRELLKDKSEFCKIQSEYIRKLKRDGKL